jgi:hypothetical protein
MGWYGLHWSGLGQGKVKGSESSKEPLGQEEWCLLGCYAVWLL